MMSLNKLIVLASVVAGSVSGFRLNRAAASDVKTGTAACCQRWSDGTVRKTYMPWPESQCVDGYAYHYTYCERGCKRDQRPALNGEKTHMCQEVAVEWRAEEGTRDPREAMDHDEKADAKFVEAVWDKVREVHERNDITREEVNKAVGDLTRVFPSDAVQIVDKQREEDAKAAREALLRQAEVDAQLRLLKEQEEALQHELKLQEELCEHHRKQGKEEVERATELQNTLQKDRDTHEETERLTLERTAQFEADHRKILAEETQLQQNSADVKEKMAELERQVQKVEQLEGELKELQRVRATIQSSIEEAQNEQQLLLSK